MDQLIRKVEVPVMAEEMLIPLPDGAFYDPVNKWRVDNPNGGDPDERRRRKSLMFGALYGADPGKVAEALGVVRADQQGAELDLTEAYNRNLRALYDSQHRGRITRGRVVSRRKGDPGPFGQLERWR